MTSLDRGELLSRSICTPTRATEPDRSVIRVKAASTVTITSNTPHPQNPGHRSPPWLPSLLRTIPSVGGSLAIGATIAPGLAQIQRLSPIPGEPPCLSGSQA